MAIQGGYGVVTKIYTSSLTTIANVMDVDFPKFMKFIAESTGHDSTSGYYTAVASGKRRVEPFTMVLAWDDAQATHAQIVTSFAADTSVAMSIQDPDGQEIIAFSAHIEEIERESRQDGVLQATVLVHPTGAPTIT